MGLIDVRVAIHMWDDEKKGFDRAKRLIEAELGGTISEEQFINMMVKQSIRETNATSRRTPEEDER